jgi:DNA-binding transcriptional regulator YhcF (GntR family)
MLIRIRRDGLSAVWEQIETALKARIRQGTLEPERPMPPAVDLAMQLRCNPAAVERAYHALIAKGWLVEGPLGVPVVSDRGRRTRRKAIEAGLRHLIDRLLGQASALSLGERELQKCIEERSGTCRQQSRSKD